MARPAITAIIASIVIGCGGAAEEGSDQDGASPAPASQQVADDLRDVSRFELTMDRMDKFFQAQSNLAIADHNMSDAERAALEAEADAETEGEDNNEQSLEQMERDLEKSPVALKAIRDAGLSAREYALVATAYMQAAMAAGMLQMQPNANQDSIARAMQMNPANLRFMQANQAELTRKAEALKADLERRGIDAN